LVALAYVIIAQLDYNQKLKIVEKDTSLITIEKYNELTLDITKKEKRGKVRYLRNL
jgi:hypothetical protein